MIRLPAILLLLCSAFWGCEKLQPQEKPRNFESKAFEEYWYAGKAEVNSYDLTQSRYGESRKGNAVLIFVSEDFSRKDHVKIDEPGKAGIEKVKVLKLNYTKDFLTGIYPYHMMLSVYTPVDRKVIPSSLKVTMSSQEWCGQFFSQLNQHGNRFSVKSFSYFEKEGDKRFSVKKVLLEDELFNMIRLDPANLPIGNMEIIPGLFFTRLNHHPTKVVKATAELNTASKKNIYSITFDGDERVLSIIFSKEFPYRILEWKEKWHEQGELRENHAKLKKTVFVDYWTKNAAADSVWRDTLQLE